MALYTVQVQKNGKAFIKLENKNEDVVSSDFVPIVVLDATYKNKDLTYVKNYKNNFTILSKHIDVIKDQKQVLDAVKFKKDAIFQFYMYRGNKDADDVTGKIEAISHGVKIITDKEEKKKDIELIDKGKVSYKITFNNMFYENKFKIKFSIEDIQKDAYIDFFASDVGAWNDWKGLQDIFCGRVKIMKKETCICEDNDWPTVAKMVEEKDKVQYGVTKIPWTNDTPECYHYALHQLRDLGYWVKTERWNKKWDGTKELNDNIYQLHLDSDVAGMKKGPQKDMFKKSLTYLKQAMKSKTPVMVGLDYHDGYANDDLITDHFAVITGCGKDSDSDGKLYFHVTDNAFSYQKYYCNCEEYEIKSEDGQNIISQVREPKKR